MAGERARRNRAVQNGARGPSAHQRCTADVYGHKHGHDLCAVPTHASWLHPLGRPATRGSPTALSTPTTSGLRTALSSRHQAPWKWSQLRSGPGESGAGWSALLWQNSVLCRTEVRPRAGCQLTVSPSFQKPPHSLDPSRHLQSSDGRSRPCHTLEISPSFSPSHLSLISCLLFCFDRSVITRGSANNPE